MSTEQGSPVIVRCEAGVFYGHLVERSEDWLRGAILDARRIWYWDGAASLSELAVSGTAKPGRCKFPAAVSRIEVTGISEVLTVTTVAAESIRAVPIWSAAG